jgi:hypothetical protein
MNKMDRPTRVIHFGTPLNVVKSSRLETHVMALARRNMMRVETVQASGWLLKRSFVLNVFNEHTSLGIFLDDLHYELLQGGHLDEAHAAQSAVVYDGTGNRIER